MERVKALLGSRGKKLRKQDRIFVGEGVQWVRSGIAAAIAGRDEIEILHLYLTPSAFEKYGEEFAYFAEITLLITEPLAKAMSDSDSSQGVIALCRYRDRTLHHLNGAKQVAYFWQLQDPGNAGTIIRTADACGLDGLIFSPNSVDIHSAKVIRSTAGSLFNLPVILDVSPAELPAFALKNDLKLLALDANAETAIGEVAPLAGFLAAYGNEARGLPTLPPEFQQIYLPMLGGAESLNVASAAAISQYLLTGLAEKK